MTRQLLHRGKSPFFPGHNPLRRSFLAAVCVTVAVFAAACGGSVSKSGSEGSGTDRGTLKVGFIAPLSGPLAPAGKEMQRGVELYLNEHGGKLGGRKVDLVVADEGSSPATGVPAAQKLLKSDRVAAVIGVANSAIALGVADTFEKAQVPLLIATAGANDITAKSNPYVWRTSYSNGVAGKSMAGYLAENATGPVYVIAPDYVSGHEIATGFTDAFKKAGGTVAGESFPPFGSTSDYQPFFSKIQQSGATAVFAWFAGAEAVQFVKQYKEFGLAGKLPLYAPGFMTDQGVLGAQGSAADGITTSLYYSAALDSPANKKFVDGYSAAYTGLPGVFPVHTYDAALLLDEALKITKGNSSGPALSKAFGSVNFDQSPRGAWKFDENHNPIETYYLLKVEPKNGSYINAVIEDLGSFAQDSN